jgi:hypothetical protein
MSTTIKIEDADLKVLREHAEMQGLEVKPSMNRTSLIALLKRSNPDLTEIPFTAEPPAAVVNLAAPSAAAPIIPPAPDVTVVSGGNSDGLMPHYSTDPKVELTVAKTTETTRSKDVTVAVNGDVFRMQRGQRISVPYRVYLAMEIAIENQAIDTGEERNGFPVRDWQAVNSYPFTVHKMPTNEEIADFHARTDSASASLSRARAA